MLLTNELWSSLNKCIIVILLLNLYCQANTIEAKYK